MINLKQYCKPMVSKIVFFVFLSILFKYITVLMAVISLTACGGETTTTQAKIDITGVTFDDVSYTADGSEKSILVKGTISQGVSVVYTNNKATNVGTYNATAMLSGNGYNTLELTATLKIKASLDSYIAVAEDLLGYLVENLIHIIC